MSISDGLCDLCGVLVELPNAARMRSHSTGRLWCGKCDFDSRREIVGWLYNEDAILNIEKTEKRQTVTVPIHRPSWDDYYMDIAFAVSKRGDCARRQHGAVVVKDHKIVSTGYNGTPPGDSRSCGKTGQCPRNLDPNVEHNKGEYDLCWATHAESNALLRAAWDDLRGATIYVTGETPCAGCKKLIKSAGIARIVGTEGDVL